MFRVPHHGGALENGGVPDGWSAQRLYERPPELAVLSVGTNNPYNQPGPAWIEPLFGRSRLLCTQVTGRCHADFEKSCAGRESSIREARESQLPGTLRGDTNHFAEPPWRHYTQNGSLHPRRLELPCAGTISVRMPATGRLRVDPAETSASLATRIARWTSPMCRPPASATASID